MKKLIIVVDIDDDIGRKTNIRGPIIGKNEVEKVAIALGYNDPEDSDLNALFKALKIYNELKKDEDVEIVVLTGDENLGSKAFLKIAKGLDLILNEIPASSCIFISDGKSDEEVLEIIKSRIKIDAVEKVYVKQSKELEKTYFVLLEKLRDPYFSKLLIAIPGIVIALLSLVFLFNIKWQYIGFILGLILIMRGYNLDREVIRTLEVFTISNNRYTNFLFLFFALILLIVSSFVSYRLYLKSQLLQLEPLARFVYSLDPIVTLLFVLLFFTSLYKLINSFIRKDTINVFNDIILATNILSFYIIYKIGYQWIVNLNPPYINFSQFLFYSLFVLTINVVINNYINSLKKDYFSSIKITNFEVYDKNNKYIGNASQLKVKKQLLKVNTPYNTTLEIPLNSIESIIENRIIVRD